MKFLALALKVAGCALMGVSALLIFGVVNSNDTSANAVGILVPMLVVFGGIGFGIYLGGRGLSRSDSDPENSASVEGATRDLRYVSSTLATGEEIVIAPNMSKWQYFPAITWLFMSMIMAMMFSTGSPVSALLVVAVITTFIAGIISVAVLPAALIALAIATIGKTESAFTVFFPMFAALTVFLTWLARYSTEFAMTNKNRIIVKVGFIARNTSEIKGETLEGTRVGQSLLGRVFGFGNIVFTGTGGKTFAWVWVADVINCRKAINDRIAV